KNPSSAGVSQSVSCEGRASNRRSPLNSRSRDAQAGLDPLMLRPVHLPLGVSSSVGQPSHHRTGVRSLEAETVRATPANVTMGLGHQRPRSSTRASGTDASPREGLTLVERTFAAVSLREAVVCVVKV